MDKKGHQLVCHGVGPLLVASVLYLRPCPKLLQHQYTGVKFTTDGINDPSTTRMINLAQHLS